MDSLTHTLTGAVIAKAIQDEKIGRWGILAGMTAGIFPDSDFLLGLIDRQFSIQYHRDFTHSLLLIPFYALFIGWFFAKVSKIPHLWRFYKICFLALLSHILIDLLTSYGTMVFSPFSHRRFAWDLVFIIDLIFSGIIFLPFLASYLFKKAAPWICRGSLLGLIIYILFCWYQQGEALEEAKGFSGRLEGQVIEIAALPQPISPFRWALFVETEEKIYQGFLDLRRKEPFRPFESPSSLFGKLKRLYDPPGMVSFRSMDKITESPWVKRALATEGLKFYQWFARFPVVKSVGSNNGRHRVEFMDLRFSLPEVRLPFVYYLEMDDTGRVLSEGFVRERKGL